MRLVILMIMALCGIGSIQARADDGNPWFSGAEKARAAAMQSGKPCILILQWDGKSLHGNIDSFMQDLETCPAFLKLCEEMPVAWIASGNPEMAALAEEFDCFHSAPMAVVLDARGEILARNFVEFMVFGCEVTFGVDDDESRREYFQVFPERFAAHLEAELKKTETFEDVARRVMHDPDPEGEFQRYRSKAMRSFFHVKTARLCDAILSRESLNDAWREYYEFERVRALSHQGDAWFRVQRSDSILAAAKRVIWKHPCSAQSMEALDWIHENVLANQFDPLERCRNFADGLRREGSRLRRTECRVSDETIDAAAKRIEEILSTWEKRLHAEFETVQQAYETLKHQPQLRADVLGNFAARCGDAETVLRVFKNATDPYLLYLAGEASKTLQTTEPLPGESHD